MTVRLVRPSLEFLPAYVAALERGWSHDNVRGLATARDELTLIARDPEAFLAQRDDPEGRGALVTLADGSRVPRLPGYYRWIWDGEFCGSIGFRWKPGTSELPAHVLGHVGYAVVPEKQGRGYATAALGLILEDARAVGLEYVSLTTDPGNIASQKVILANGGRLIERFRKIEALGGGESLLFHIPLARD